MPFWSLWRESEAILSKKVSSRHMISRTGGQASKYLFATNDVITRIRVFIMIRSLTGKNLHKHILTVSTASVIWDLNLWVRDSLFLMHKIQRQVTIIMLSWESFPWSFIGIYTINQNFLTDNILLINYYFKWDTLWGLTKGHMIKDYYEELISSQCLFQLSLI